jgi:CBS domain-containing protein
MRAADMMTRSLWVVTPNESVSDAASMMATHDVGMLPVVDTPETMRLVGVITDRDIALRHVAPAHDAACTVRSHMTSDGLVTVRQDADAHDIMGRMRSRQVRRIPVIDEEHRVVGVVAQADVARHVGPTEPVAFEKMMQGLSEPALTAV